MSSVRPTSKRRAAVLVRAAFEATDEAGGPLPLRDVKRAVAALHPAGAKNTPHAGGNDGRAQS